ncbi:MAG: NAD-dependent epimerase/dehydratase family protein [Opitutaceae bacterium]|jgi:nucleoside-diphosphate-sugar epimerase
MATVLITGVAGFIGPHVVEACLARNWRVVGVDILSCDLQRPGFAFRQKDIRDLSPEELGGVDYIVHLAFVTNIPNSIQHPIETTRNNIEMTARLLDIATKAGVKKVAFPSTASLFGNNPTPWREDMPADPIEPYSWQKLSCESLCRMWSTRYGLPTVVLRLFQVFGENQRKDTAMAAFFRARQEGRPITLTETTAQSSFRTGQRDFVYVKEVADAFALALESAKTGQGEIINIGTGRVTTMEAVANAIGGEVIFIPRRGFEVERHQADISRAEALLDWHPKVEVIEWLNAFVPTLAKGAEART